MAEGQNSGIFDFYTRLNKSWADILGSYTRMGDAFGGPFRIPTVDAWFKPFWGYTADWGKLNATFVEMTRALPFGFESAKAVSEASSRNINTYVRIYDAWLKSMEKVSREGFDVGRRLGAGETVDVEKTFETLRSAYENISASLVESLKETPFAGAGDVTDAVKRALDSLPEEQKTARELLGQLLAFGEKVTSLSSKATAEAAGNLTTMLEKGTVSVDSYRNLIDSYGKTLKDSIGIAGQPAVLSSAYKDVVDGAIELAHRNLDVYVSQLEMDLRLLKGLRESFGVISNAVKGLTSEITGFSPDGFYRRWAEAYQKATTALVENTEVFASMARSIDAYLEYVKAANKFYRSVMTLGPVATAETVRSPETDKSRTRSVPPAKVS